MSNKNNPPTFPLSHLTIPLLLLFLFIPSLSLGAFKGDMSKEELLNKNFKSTDDLDAIIERRIIRILTPYNKTFFFFDGVEPKGLSYEAVMGFENFLNKKLRTKHLKVRTIVVPTARDQLIPRLKDGFGDIAIGNLTITENRLKLVDFSDPFLSNVDEILVTGSRKKNIKNLFDLAGKEIHVRTSSSYYESLVNLNKVLSSSGKPKVKLITVNDNLEDEDLLEMVNADIIPMIIIDNHKGELWKKILPNIVLHPEIKVNSGGRIAWAVRKNNPKLKQVINEYAAKNKKGTLMGNMAFNKYLRNTKYITDSMHGEEIKRFKQIINLFEKYGQKYNFDHLMLAALAFQESRLDQSVRSHVGAIGVMQILPSTAGDKNVDIIDIEKIEPNIHAGTKYLRFIANRYFSEDTGIDPFDRAFFSFASYNAGPSKVARMRREAEAMGLDPDVWFNNVEVVAAKRIGRETVQYVSNILKYYVAYKLLSEKFESSNTQ